MLFNQLTFSNITANDSRPNLGFLAASSVYFQFSDAVWIRVHGGLARTRLRRDGSIVFWLPAQVSRVDDAWSSIRKITDRDSVRGALTRSLHGKTLMRRTPLFIFRSGQFFFVNLQDFAYACVCVCLCYIVRTGRTLKKIKNVKEMTFVDIDVCHRTASLHKLYYVTLTYLLREIFF